MRKPLCGPRFLALCSLSALFLLALAPLGCDDETKTHAGDAAAADGAADQASDTIAADSSDGTSPDLLGATDVQNDLTGDTTLADQNDLADTAPADTTTTDTTAAELPPDVQTWPTTEDDAAILSTTIPTTMHCGDVFDAELVVQNRGTATWTFAAGYKLGAVDDSDPFTGPDPRVWLADTDSIATGQTHTFALHLVAPSGQARFVTDWQMVHEGVRWFGEQGIYEVFVDCPGVVDATTLTGKQVMGYQGWFAAPGDGGPLDRWIHWFRNGVPDAGNATFDLWPDLSEMDADERFPTNMTLPSGQPAELFSSLAPKTVDRHFAWMEDNGIDGVMLQRFSSELSDPAFLAMRDQIARNVMVGAEAHGRVFAMMYDISGHNSATIVDELLADWTHLVDDVGVLQSPRYLHHRGKPLLAIWGFGFNDRAGEPAQAAALIAALQSGLGPNYQVTLMGGVPTYWRTLNNDSKTDPAWAAVYRSFDVISPWAVGRYDDLAGANTFRTNLIVPDLAAARAAGADYMPVIFPGFSWFNLLGDPLNAIPRLGGTFYWRQAYNAIDAGADMLFVAMFDEVDEGTAMFKAAPTQNQVPVQGQFLSLDADGQALPSDWYLRLAGESSKMLRGDIALTQQIPITP